MTTTEDGPHVDRAWLAQRIDYRLYQDCVHCGLCTASCPTYLETGDENHSPRGRIYLMRAVADGRLGASDDVRDALELCLDCRACETACPSGVQYGRLIEPYKVALQAAAQPRTSALLRFVLKHVFPYANRVRWALAPARWLQRLGLFKVAERTGVMAALPASIRQLIEALPQRLEPPRRLPRVSQPLGPRRARVALFTGCVADVMAPQTHAATLRVLQRNGCEVVVPAGQVCCGAIHYHSGFEAPALELARRNREVFQAAEYDAVIVNAAGCGAMLKDYPHLLPAAERETTGAFVGKVKDVCEFLAELGIESPKAPLPIDVTYHDACHLCHAQGVRSAPRELLARIPGLRVIPLAESEICCGAAGTYNLTQPEMSQRLAERKRTHILETGAGVVATGNIGCQLQIERALRGGEREIDVVHTIELLDRAYAAEDAARSPANSPRRD